MRIKDLEKDGWKVEENGHAFLTQQVSNVVNCHLVVFMLDEFKLREMKVTYTYKSKILSDEIIPLNGINNINELNSFIRYLDLFSEY